MNAIDLVRMLEPATMKALSLEDFQAVMPPLKALLASFPADRLAQLSALHPEAEVRRAAVEALAPHLPAQTPALLHAMHDPVDGVSFTAIRILGEHQVQEALPQLASIVGWPSFFTSPGYRGKPVGVGAAIAHHAIMAILGSRGLEVEHEMRSAAPEAPRQPHLAEAVYVPTGPFKAGGPQVDDAFHGDAGDNPFRTETLDGFWIDRYAVTNRRYRVFLDDVGASKAFAHPDEPPNKDYTPSTWRDARFTGADLPVTGIDWYDAWAYARWAGGWLPSELEWEKAARGPDGRRYPWGAWNPACANFADRAYRAHPTTLAELETLQRTVSPPAPLLPADALPEGDSPCGARQMSGNVWEMTRTNFRSYRDMDPFFRGRHPSEFVHRPEALYVLRGGCWSSPPSFLLPYYRCQELITCRQSEIGFRCVYYASFSDTAGSPDEG